MQIVKFLQDILPAIAQLAALTSTTIDDTICEFIRLAITNELVAKWLQDLLDQGLSAEGCAGLGAPSEVKDALSARGIDWSNLVTNVLPKVLKLIALIR
jgi:hypothetical protein